MMPAMSINYLAVLACAIVAMPVGFLWFGPLFGKAWARHMGFGGMQQTDAGLMGKAMAIFFVGNLLKCVGACPQHRSLAGLVLGAVSGCGAMESTWIERRLFQLAGVFLAGCR